MRTHRTEEVERILDRLYENLKSVRKETIEKLGNKDALHIIDFHANNWIDIIKWIVSKYSKEEQMNITIFQFSRLFKEIYWLQLLFLKGNYPLMYRNLRYILELICQAYYVDNKYPSLSLDEQVMKNKEIETEIYGWKLVKDVIQKVLNYSENQVDSEFKLLWIYLNKHAHPSAFQMGIVATEDFSSLITDSFNETLARDALKAVDEVFDIVDMIMFKRFSKIKEIALKYEFLNEWKKFLPNTTRIIRERV
ncbi:MAG: hypothetical protein QXV46_05460 [Candidatus Bathyarchaeia archaeon]